MSLRDKIQLVLCTYNRKKYLKRTLEQLFAENSPIKDFDITILNNASNDGTSELIDEFCEKFPNIKHISRKVNIGGCANICGAYELGVNLGKEYVWVLCDDDRFDFSGWHEVEKLVEEKTDVICVADYCFKTPQQRKNPAYQLLQLTFVPGGIYRTELITDNVLTNMYNAIYTMFQSPCIAISAINNEKSIKVLSKSLVCSGLLFENADDIHDVSYTRGIDEKEMLKRNKDNCWVLGYANVLTLLKDKSKITEFFEAAVPFEQIYGSWEKFFNCYGVHFGGSDKFNYFYEIYLVLSEKHKKILAERYCIDIQIWLKKAGFPVKFTFPVLRKIFKSFIQTLFSVKNCYDGKHKTIRFLGLKLNVKKLKK